MASSLTCKEAIPYYFSETLSIITCPFCAKDRKFQKHLDIWLHQCERKGHVYFFNDTAVSGVSVYLSEEKESTGMK